MRDKISALGLDTIRRLELKVSVSVRDANSRGGRWRGDEARAACAGAHARSHNMRLCGCCIGQYVLLSLCSLVPIQFAELNIVAENAN